MTIGRKIVAGFSVLLLVLVIFAFVSSYQLTRTNNEYQDLLNDRVKQSKMADDIQLAMALQGLYIRSYVIEQNESDLPLLAKQQESLAQTIQELRTYVHSDTMKDLLKEAEEGSVAFNAATVKIIDAVNNGDVMKARQLLLDEAKTANVQILTAGEGMLNYQGEMIVKDTKATEDGAAKARNAMWAAAIAAIVVGIAIAFIISRMISRPLNQLTAATAIIAEGDLSIPDIEVKTKDEIRALADAFNAMKENLRGLISGVNDNSLHVTASAEELSASMDEVSKSSQGVTKSMEMIAAGSQRSAASAKDSSIAMEETATGLQRIAEATQHLQSNTMDTMELADSSERAVGLAKEQMNTIHSSARETSELIQKLARQSAEIEQITTVITAITEQTNLLALNAAIEAARAGEHGKGFAVVADEVRKLAEESKASANQIVALTAEIQNDTKAVERSVNGSLQNVEAGVQVIDDTGKAFTTILTAVRKMSEQVEDISSATEQISASAEEVAATVQEIASQAEEASSQTEQTTAATEEQMATVEEVNSVAQDLSRQAMNLSTMIQRFKV